LVCKVHYKNTSSELILDSIITNLDCHEVPNLHEQNINSIMQTHVLGRVWPYFIPKSFMSTSEKEIALYLFSKFECKATIGICTDTLKIKIGSLTN